MAQIRSEAEAWTYRHSYYNTTVYSGLEINISNSYANSLLQLLYFTPVVRNAALNHTATRCIAEMCMLCEMGFLFDMLQKAEGLICQATNLLRTMGHIPQGTRPARSANWGSCAVGRKY